MDRNTERGLMRRAKKLGDSGKGEHAEELMGMLGLPSGQVRRLAVSALGKLAGLADAEIVVAALLPRLRDGHPQVRQYAIKALSAYGPASGCALDDLRDIAVNRSEKEYNQRDANNAVGVIEEALRIAEEQAEHRCQRCRVPVEADEYARSRRAFQRVFCDRCFDEVYLDRRNFDTRVELNKTIHASDGTFVQSAGERRICEFLSRKGFAYRYDERIRIVEGYAVRPDFYLPELDVYIEYWGMDTTDYKIGMLKKQKLYQQAGKRVISLYPRDLRILDDVLQKKLARYARG